MRCATAPPNPERPSGAGTSPRLARELLQHGPFSPDERSLRRCFRRPRHERLSNGGGDADLITFFDELPMNPGAGDALLVGGALFPVQEYRLRFSEGISERCTLLLCGPPSTGARGSRGTWARCCD